MSQIECPLLTQLTGIHERARREKKWRFDNLCSLLTIDMLRWSYFQLRRRASTGVDRVDWETYGEQLSERLASLHDRLMSMHYRAPAVRRVYIPKANGKQRPLGIPTVEDKIVQRAVAEIFNHIFEADFLPVSYGYRPNRGARDAHRDLGAELNHGIYGHVVEADIKGFFTNIDHDWLIRMLEERINDRKLIRLIRKWLKAGILEPDGQLVHPVSGTPQGGIISPILANIYLHFALDLWFVKRFRKECKGRVFIMRYADDFVAGFQYQSDAESFEEALPKRLGKFHLETEPSKTGRHLFSRFAVAEGGSFDFLGFTFRWAMGRNGKPHVARTTSRKTMHASLRAFQDWIKRARSWPRRLLFPALGRKLTGLWNYFGVNGNSYRLAEHWRELYLLCFKWLNRSSQRRSYTMNGLNAALRANGITAPCITESPHRIRKPFLWTCT